MLGFVIKVLLECAIWLHSCVCIITHWYQNSSIAFFCIRSCVVDIHCSIPNILSIHKRLIVAIRSHYFLGIFLFFWVAYRLNLVHIFWPVCSEIVRRPYCCVLNVMNIHSWLGLIHQPNFPQSSDHRYTGAGPPRFKSQISGVIRQNVILEQSKMPSIYLSDVQLLPILDKTSLRTMSLRI